MALVSSAWHLPRVRRLCLRNGLEATLIGADFAPRGTPFSLLQLVPSASGVTLVQLALWERLGMLVGR